MEKLNHYFKNVGALLGGIFFVLAIIELALRAFGYKPIPNTTANFHSNNENIYQIDSVLGYTLHPGTHQLNHFDKIITEINVCDNKSRTTGDCNNTYDSTQLNIHLYGCSNTFGYNLLDSMTLAWKLNENPNLNVLNFGCPGYSLLQSYLWLKQNVVNKIVPNVLIINYGSYIDQRNVMAQSWQNNLTKFSTRNDVYYPRVTIENSNLKIEYILPKNKNFIGSRKLALANFLNTKFNFFERQQLKAQQTTKLLLSEINQFAKQHNFSLLICGIDENPNTKRVINWCNKNNINAIDIGLDIMDNKYNLMPNDIHPNSLANTIYTNKIENYLVAKYNL